MRFRLVEEYLNNKVYLFRGVSNNKDQRNYHYRSNDGLNSRYYSWEAFDGIYMFGNVQIFELLPNANLFDYGDSSEEFCNEYDLMDVESKLLYKRYGIHTLNDMKENGGSIELDRHDEYHAYQCIATEYLEKTNDYDGIIWYEPMDNPSDQIQIWNNGVIRKVPYKEAKELINQLAKINPDMYDNGKDFWDKKFELSKR